METTQHEKYRLLLVEDEEDLRNAISSMLTDDGFDCVGAGNGLEAKTKLERYNFDLIMTDNQMPYMNGISLLSWCRKVHMTVPAILYTGDFMSASALSKLKNELHINVISKPSSIETISEAILDALQPVIQLN